MWFAIWGLWKPWSAPSSSRPARSMRAMRAILVGLRDEGEDRQLRALNRRERVKSKKMVFAHTLSCRNSLKWVWKTWRLWIPRRLLRLEVRKITASTPLSRQTRQLHRSQGRSPRVWAYTLRWRGSGLGTSTGRELLIPIQDRPVLHHRVEAFVSGPRLPAA